MTTSQPPIAPNTSDSVLRQLIALVESHPAKPGPEITVYLPWGAATGELVSKHWFYQTVIGELRHHGDVDTADQIGAAELTDPDVNDYVHLFRGLRCLVGSQVVRHAALRVRLADITAWTIGAIHPTKQPEPPHP